MLSKLPKGSTILQIVPSLEVGGPERSTLDVAAAIVKAGHRAFVISAGGRMVEELERSGARHFSWEADSKNPLVLWKNHQLLKDFIREEKVDLVHVRSRAPAWSAYLATRALGVPLVTTFHATYKGVTPWKKFYNGVMARGDHIIAISQFIADEIRKDYGIAAKRITVIPRGIDLAIYNRDAVIEPRKDRFRDFVLLPANAPFLLMPARLMPIKGQELVLRALAKLSSHPFFCLIVGPDQEHHGYHEHLVALSRKLDLQNKVSFLEHVDLPAAYALADLVLCPSQVAEGFGRVAAEAQAMGVPVIATTLGAMRETVLDGQTGWLVPPENSDALANAIVKSLAMSKEQRQRMAEKAVQHARANFDMQRMCDSTLAVYAGLLQGKNGKP